MAEAENGSGREQYCGAVREPEGSDWQGDC
jgi:hypothetical protein